MEKISLPPSQLCSSVTFFRPNRPVLVTTCNRDGTTHVAPFAWCIPASYNPPMVTLALLSTPRKQHSLVNIERDGEFVVNLPGYDLSPDLVRASYRYPAGVYKMGILGFEFSPAQCVEVPIIKGARAHVECRLQTSLVTGDHTLLVADVVAASYAPEQYHEGFILDVEKYPPCLHLGHIATQHGQAHTFIVRAGVETLELPYNLPRQVSDTETGTAPSGPGAGQAEDRAGRETWQAEATVFATGFACPEGPCSNEGNLFVVDWAAGVVCSVTPEGRLADFIDTGGMPAGAFFGPNGHLTVCDPGRKEVLSIAPDGVVQVVAAGHSGESFLGPQDCTFDARGNLYFSDADGFAPLDPSGVVYLLRPDGDVELFATGFAFPNGLAVSNDGVYLFLSETFANRIYRFTLDESGHARKREVFAELDGGLGPDGLALDDKGNLYVAHFGKGVVAVLDPEGRLLAELGTEGLLPTSLTFWNGSLYVTELERGCVIRLDVKPKG
jgi:gluconolactonase